jgi:hypothetical protein
MIIIYSGHFSINPSPTAEPLYLQFPDHDLLNLWLVLLRSYAMPEVYGRWINSQEGGLYRMWRQVELTCIQGRNLGAARSLVDDLSIGDPDDNLDIDVYCSLCINGYLCGKTTVRKGVGSPDWHEGFTFTDLPPFETLEVMVWRHKRLAKPVLIGTIAIPLMNFRRGEHVEGWFPVLSSAHLGSTMTGEVRLKLRVDE